MKHKKIIIILITLAALGLTFYMSSGPPGYIKLETPGMDARMVIRKGGWLDKRIHSGEQAVRVSAGRYRPVRINLSTFNGRDQWQLQGDGPWGRLDSIEVQREQMVTLKAGPPFTLKADVNDHRGMVFVDYLLIGQAGERYRQVFKDGRLMTPKVKIMDESGKLLTSGKFEYG